MTVPAQRAEPPARPGLRRTLRLARRILAVHASQPATALWRLVEARVVLDHLSGQGRGLDFGCGDGTLATVLFEPVPGVRWSGIDLDAQDVALARGRGIYDEVHLASAAEIPEPDASFDLVFSNSALEHMTPLRDVLIDVARVLAPGGRLVFTVPVADFRSNLLWGRIMRRLGLSGMAEKYLRHIDRRVAHVNYLSAEEWYALASESGFRIRRTVPYLSRRSLACWETLANLTGGVAYLLAGGKKSPRDIQRTLKVEEGTRPWVGRLLLFLLWPVIAFMALERKPAHFSAVYVEAVR